MTCCSFPYTWFERLYSCSSYSSVTIFLQVFKSSCQSPDLKYFTLFLGMVVTVSLFLAEFWYHRVLRTEPIVICLVAFFLTYTEQICIFLNQLFLQHSFACFGKALVLKQTSFIFLCSARFSNRLLVAFTSSTPLSWRWL